MNVFASNSPLRLLFREVRKLNLKPVKRMHFQFDPFHENAEAIRSFLFHVTSKRVRRTNEYCMFKTDILNNRSNPVINIQLENGTNITFKTANLTAQDITEEFNKIIDSVTEKEEYASFVARSRGLLLATKIPKPNQKPKKKRGPR